LDVKNVFLNGDLLEKIYTEQPPILLHRESDAIQGDGLENSWSGSGMNEGLHQV